MRIISRKIIIESGMKYPLIKAPLDAWYHLVKRADWNSLAELKCDFPSADYVQNDRYVFNIKGNHFRIVAKINFTHKIVYMRFIGTHKEYDKIIASEV